MNQEHQDQQLAEKLATLERIREAQRRANKKYREAHPEKFRGYSKKYYEANREKQKESMRQHYLISKTLKKESPQEIPEII